MLFMIPKSGGRTIQKIQSVPLSSGDSQTTLYLTNIRSIQQTRPDIKAKLKDKFFRTRKVPPKFCNTFRVAFVKYINGNPVNVRFGYISCNSWTCPRCQIRRALKVKYYLRDVIVLNNLSYFLTLTLNPKKVPNEYLGNTHKYITKLFNHFNTILKRKYKKDFKEILKYIWVIEYQKNSNAHLHILYNQFLPIDLIRSLWVHVGGGHIMRIEPIKTLVGISNYITDYIVKGIKNNKEENFIRFLQRRYSISKSCIRPKINSINKVSNEIPQQNLEWVYNYLNSSDFKEKEITLPASKIKS